MLLSSSVLWASLVNAQSTPQTPNKIRPSFKRDSSLHHPPIQWRQGKHKAFAQRNRVKNFTQKNLQLSKEQVLQQKNINENYHKQLATLQKNDKMSLGEYKNKIAVLKKDRKEKMQAVLTIEQKSKLEDAKKRMQENRQVKTAANLERMKIRLNLSNEQVAKIKANQTAFKNKLKALHENNALLPEQKKEELKTLATQQKEWLKSVLTTDQQTKLDSLKNKFRGGYLKKQTPISK